MRITVHAKPNSKEARIEKVSETEYIVAVKEPPVQGRANQAIIKALAEYFHTSPFHVKIVQGYISRIKTIEIN